MPPESQGLWTVSPTDRDMTLAEMLAAGMVCRSWRCGLASPTGELLGLGWACRRRLKSHEGA